MGHCVLHVNGFVLLKGQSVLKNAQPDMVACRYCHKAAIASPKRKFLLSFATSAIDPAASSF
jgi:hypothetical protein